MSKNDAAPRPMSGRAEQLLSLTGIGQAVLRDRRAEQPMTERHKALLAMTGIGQAILRERAKKGGA